MRIVSRIIVRVYMIICVDFELFWIVLVKVLVVVIVTRVDFFFELLRRIHGGIFEMIGTFLSWRIRIIISILEVGRKRRHSSLLSFVLEEQVKNSQIKKLTEI